MMSDGDVLKASREDNRIVCRPAGVGKTRAVSLFRNHRRPLYWVHSGQLGLNVGEMEKALKMS
jgi:hypothetical protein